MIFSMALQEISLTNPEIQNLWRRQSLPYGTIIASNNKVKSIGDKLD